MKRNNIIQLTLLAGTISLIIYYTQPNKNVSAYNITESSMVAYNYTDIINQPIVPCYSVSIALMDRDSVVLIDTMQQFFYDYEKRGQLYLDRDCFNGTPISGKLLKDCAKNAYDSTGIIVPLELALSQAQWESGMGLKGRSPKNNPYNIGEWNTLGITTIYFHSTEQGVQTYYYLMATKYLNNKSIQKLLINFVNLNGYRYAHSKTYEHHIKQQYYYISRWIEKNDTVL